MSDWESYFNPPPQAPWGTASSQTPSVAPASPSPSSISPSPRDDLDLDAILRGEYSQAGFSDLNTFSQEELPGLTLSDLIHEAKEEKEGKNVFQEEVKQPAITKPKPKPLSVIIPGRREKKSKRKGTSPLVDQAKKKAESFLTFSY